MESAAVPQNHPSELVNTANALILAQPVPASEKDTNPESQTPPQPTSEPSASESPIIAKNIPSTSDSAMDAVLNGPFPEQEDLQSGDTDSGSPSHTPSASTLPPNYPPVVYPAVVSPGPTLRELSENNDTMEIDGPPENKDSEDDHMEEEKEEDASSEVSAGTDLKNDLEEALQGDFDFKGNYAFATPLPQAPNPGLHIEGLGLIGMPLSERDAKLIIGCAAQAPFGHGERTVVDTEVRDTFEIEPARVSFQNPTWDFFVKDLVSRSVWPELGAGPCTTAPGCSLYKLLLYQTGSHFLPHQDTEKEQGMFATIIIVLPSLYTGGEVHVSHGNTRKIFDLASSSAFTTSLLTWYTDVMHEVKPITSGYRLALSYNLIHMSPGIPRPTLPNMHSAVSHLRHILHKWSKGAYDGSDEETDIIAYLLQHEYSHVNLKMGALKGKDAHLVANLREVAEEEGFMVCLANLEYNISGVADDDGRGYYGGYGGRKRNRWYDDSDDDDDDDDGEAPSMIEETDTSMKVDNLVDLDGLSMMGGNLNLSQENLIPENPFEGVEPDDKEYEGYMGNGAGSLEYWYRRTVLVLFPTYKELDIMLNTGGVSYALQRLKSAGPRSPTQEDRKMANYVLARINPRDKVYALAMADLAIQWNDLAMWNQIVKASGAEKSLDMIGKDKLIAAWDKFSFENVRLLIEEILKNSTGLKARSNLINSLSAHAPEGERAVLREWTVKQMALALSSLKNPNKEDIPVLITIVRSSSNGLSFLSKKLLPQLIKIPSIYDFWIEFLLALQQNKAVFLTNGEASTSAGASAEAQSPFDKVLHRCLNAAVRQWDSVAAQPRSYPYYGYTSSEPSSSKISRIVQLADFCITSRHLKSCENLLALVINSQGDLTNKFKTLYTPLISELRQVLTRKEMDMSSYPFGEFFRIIIGTYLQHILGAKPRQTRVPKMRKIGCGCVDCRAINTFLFSANSQQMFRYAQSRRTHMEGYLRAAPDLVTYSTIRSGSPHGLVVSKSQDIVAAAQWLIRQGEAKTFLVKIGGDAVISKIMGDQHADVPKALDGSQQFRLTVVDTAGPTKPALSNPAAPVPPGPVDVKAPNSSTVAGQKRKKTPEVDGDIIDLTVDSP